MEITWYGTASLGIESDGNRILIDPFFNRNPKLPCARNEDFAAYNSIFLTHGHFDHLADVPEILSESNAVVYCTQTPAKTLRRLGVSGDRINIINDDSRIRVNGFDIDVYKSRHVVFDAGTILKHAADFDFYRHLPTAMRILSTTVTMPEAGETVAYHVRTANDDAFVLGSLNYDSNVEYPTKINTLVLPYNGCSGLVAEALAVTEKFEPSNVLLDHYDDSFPPITTYVDTSVFTELMRARHPEINVQCLRFCEAAMRTEGMLREEAAATAHLVPAAATA